MSRVMLASGFGRQSTEFFRHCRNVVACGRGLEFGISRQASLLEGLAVLALHDHQRDPAAGQVFPMHVIERSSLQGSVALLRNDADPLAEIGEVSFGFDPSTLYG